MHKSRKYISAAFQNGWTKILLETENVIENRAGINTKAYWLFHYVMPQLSY